MRCSFESELARLLAAAARDGSKVSRVFRSAWGYERMERRIRGKVYSPPAPASVVGHITIDELTSSRVSCGRSIRFNGFGTASE